MVLQYSNQETSVTIGESVRDEDGTHQSLPTDNHLDLLHRAPTASTEEFV